MLLTHISNVRLKMADETKRENRLQVLLSEDERARLNAVANEQGMKPSVYARAEIIKAVKRDE